MKLGTKSWAGILAAAAVIAGWFVMREPAQEVPAGDGGETAVVEQPSGKVVADNEGKTVDGAATRAADDDAAGSADAVDRKNDGDTDSAAAGGADDDAAKESAAEPKTGGTEPAKLSDAAGDTGTTDAAADDGVATKPDDEVVRGGAGDGDGNGKTVGQGIGNIDTPSSGASETGETAGVAERPVIGDAGAPIGAATDGAAATGKNVTDSAVDRSPDAGTISLAKPRADAEGSHAAGIASDDPNRTGNDGERDDTETGASAVAGSGNEDAAGKDSHAAAPEKTTGDEVDEKPAEDAADKTADGTKDTAKDDDVAAGSDAGNGSEATGSSTTNDAGSSGTESDDTASGGGVETEGNDPDTAQADDDSATRGTTDGTIDGDTALAMRDPASADGARTTEDTNVEAGSGTLSGAEKDGGSETDPATALDTEPKGDLDEAATAATPTDPDAPTFDLVRIDQDGQAVLAGRAKPNTDVEIVLDGKVVETVKTDGDGNFVAILETEVTGEARNLQLRVPVVVEEVPVSPTGIAELGGPVIRDAGSLTGGTGADAAPETGTMIAAVPTAPSAVDDPAVSTTAPRGDAALPRRAEPAEPTPAAPAGLAVTTAPSTLGDIRTDIDDGLVTDGRGDPIADRADPPETDLNATAAIPADAVAPAAVPGNRYRTSAPVIILPASDVGDAPTVLSATPNDLKILQPSVTDINSIVLDLISYGQAGEVVLMGRGRAGQAVRIYGNGQIIGTTRIAADGTWRMNVAENRGREIKLLRLDEIDDKGRVTTRIEAPFQYAQDKPKIVRERRVVIQKGDMLWRIAEQHYGEGLRYSLIYGANSALIRDPDLIYPGQEITVPELIDADQ